MTETLNDAATDPQQTIAELQRELAERTAERDELLQQRTATADMLKVISRSAFDLESALVNVCETAARLCDADQAAIYRREGDLYHFAASFGFPQEYADAWRAAGPAPNDPKSPLVGHRAVAERRPVQVLDVTADPAFLGSTSRASQSRTALGIPLMREGKPVGNFVLARQRVEAFTDRQLELVQTFADQAVIAIENARLFNETREALDRQTATAEILNVIASSPTDTQPVFDVIARSATELCEGMNSGVYLLQNGLVHVAGHHNVSPEQFALARTAFPTPPHRGIMSGRAIIDRAVAHVPDIAADPEYTAESIVKAGFRSVVAVPMLRNGEPIGAINVTREEARPFSDRQIELLRTFADQAVIAIENSRLFNETQEALERQTASADILKVIASSPSDVQPVFNAVVLTARRLLGREMAAILLCGDDATFRPVAGAGPDGLVPIDPIFAVPTKIDPEANFPSRAIVSKKNLHLPDWSAIDLPEQERNMREMIGWNSTLYLPMLRGEECIGVLLVGGTQPGIFSEADIALAESFRDQAVIAIENARLFNETQEALERQTATSEVLQVISNSISNPTPVFERILESTERLITFEIAAIFLAMPDEQIDLAAFRGAQAAAMQGLYPRPLAQSLLPIMMATRRQICFEDAANGPDVPTFLRQIALATTKGNFSIAMTPLMWEGNAIGMLNVGRDPGVKFNEKELSLLRTFADQAVIAIQNARLFEEVQARTRDLQESLEYQTATSDVLKVISRSSFDLQPVLDTLVDTAVKLCGALNGTICLREGDGYRYRASSGIHGDWAKFLDEHPPMPGRSSMTGRVLLSGRPESVPDVLEDPDYVVPLAAMNKTRSVFGVPLLRHDRVEGVLLLARAEPGLFTQRQIELVQTFADQAVIAIENARLLTELRQRTDDLTESLEHLRTAQDRLVQTEKLASLGQLTAGIAHEIKNPLNFVNNFSALSAELIDELGETLAPAPLDRKMRGDVDELTQMLKSNLEKVVQHGKRADSIVKNMLLHSREGAGEQRPADINALLDESLNLAYHGARAEKPGFNITLQRDFDASAGAIELFPQEITRALLNLISNGFYAASKRKAENGDPDFEPVLSATTKNLGSQVEIRIRDNGTGIPTEVKEKIFNPFFTTKPAGEGTGLGLSMSHDIIVKQHGGRIEVDTEPGRFTEFTIILPRTGNLANNRKN